MIAVNHIESFAISNKLLFRFYRKLEYPYGRGIKVFVNISAITAGSAVVTIQGKDPSGNYYTVLASASLTATGETVLTVYPGTTAAANSVANDVLPRQWRVSVAVTTGPVNMNVSACLIV